MPSMISFNRAWVIPNGAIALASARVTGCCGLPAKSCATSPRHRRPRRRRLARLVHGVVDFAAKGIEGRDRVPALRRQEQERIVEARAALRCFLLTVFVRSHRITSARE